jgi:tetratricopeptide (TPR) repeat protein
MWLAAVLLLSAAELAATDCQRTLNWRPGRDNNVVFADLNAAIEANPTDACAFNNRARVYMFYGDTERAVADYDTAIRLNPNMAFAYKNRADAWIIRNEIDRAILDYGAAIRLDPKYSQAYRQRGLAYYRKRDYASAIADFTEEMRLGSGSYIARGDAYRDSGQLDRALADYMVVIKTGQRDPRGWRGRASVRVLTGDDRGAVADYDKALFYDARDAPSWSARGAARLRLGDRDGAIADFRKALELKPDLASAREGLEQLGVK